jgi:leucyl aminopeptidase
MNNSALSSNKALNKTTSFSVAFRQANAVTASCDLLVVCAFQDAKRLSPVAVEIDALLEGALSTALEQDRFVATLGSSCVLPTFGKLKARKVAVMGLGLKADCRLDHLRRVAAAAVKLAGAACSAEVVIALPSVADLDPRHIVEAMTEGAYLSAYRFHTYHGTLRKAEADKHRVTRVILMENDSRQARGCREAVEHGRVVSEATCYARDLVNTPSGHMTPKHLVEEAKKWVGKSLTLTVMDRAAMERKKMHAALAVAAGSQHEPYGVHLIYRPRGAKKRIVLVGKAVTFDSGGLSLKPADAMMTMKIDMAGAATVLGVFQALSRLGAAVEVHGIFLAVENMPSGTAYRPGDVVTAMDGTTIEVLNTDAEGRVTLADALSYAKTLEPDMIIDLATLTGACVVALGEEIAGLMGNDEKLIRRLKEAGEVTGEAIWELPLFSPYMELIKSKIADLKNIGGKAAGAITAGLFLKPFVGDIPWAHIDLAGPSYIERETRPDLPYGASGYGVRLLVSFLEKLK